MTALTPAKETDGGNRHDQRQVGGARVPDSATLGYEPALDGLRALAVVAVLLFHSRFSWIPGGFLGVSTFFTLSGFLITTLMLTEWRRSNGIGLRRFYRRRFRRLLPASWFTLILVVAMGAAGVWSNDQIRSLRGDVPASMAEVSNWWFIAQDRSYGALFEAPSPLEHFWSLAVEQQFYLLFPIVVMALLVLGRSFRRRHPTLVPLVAGLLLATVASAWLNHRFAGSSITRAYFGTDSRLAELTIGALMACLGIGRLRARGWTAAVFSFVGVVGLAASGALWYLATVPSAWLYPWGLLATSAASCALIVGAMNRGPLRAALTVAPVVALGRISYGVYLLHWPIFLWLNPTRIDLPQWPLFGLRMIVTIAAAALMFRVLESPIRSGIRLPRPTAAYALMPAAAVLLVGTALVTGDIEEPSALAAASVSTTTVPPPAPTRVLVVGDATAQMWAEDTVGTEEAPLEVTVIAAPGCGVAVGGYVRAPDGTVERDVDRCGALRDLWVDTANEQRPQVVIVSSSLRDVADRRFDVDTAWVAPGDPTVDDFLATEARELISALSESGASVMVATAPHMRNSTAPPPPPPPMLPTDPGERVLRQVEALQIAQGVPPPGFAENDTSRIDRWNKILLEAAEARSGESLPVASTMVSWPGGEFDPLRRLGDGVGTTALGSAELSAALAERIRAARPPAVVADPVAEIASAAALPVAPPITPRRTVDPGRTADVLVVGDSVAFNIGLGLDTAAVANGTLDVTSAGQFGCPIARGGRFRFLRNVEEFPQRCDWATLYPEFLQTHDPDVVVVASGIWDVVDRRLQGDDRFRNVGDDLVDRYILAEFLGAIDALGSEGASVVVMTYPHFEAGRDQGFTGLPESDPDRVDRLNEILAEAVSLRPGVATLVDFQGWLASQPGGELDPSKRTDGLHFFDSYSPVIGDWLAPQVIDVARNGVLPPP